MATTPTSALAFVLTQTQENIRFLRSSNQLSANDAEIILAKLSAAPALHDMSSSSPRASHGPSGFSMPLPGMDNLNINNPVQKPPALSRPPPPIPSSFLFKARAIWAYNEDDKVIYPYIAHMCLSEHLCSGVSRSQILARRYNRNHRRQECGLVARSSAWKRRSLPVILRGTLCYTISA